MTTKTLPTLEDIAIEAGLQTFSRWKDKAEREWKASQYLYMGAEAKHAFIYEHILKEYKKHE